MPSGFSKEELIEAVKTPAVIVAFTTFPLGVASNFFGHEVRTWVLILITAAFLLIALFSKSQANRVLSGVFAVIWGAATGLIIVLQAKGIL